MDLKAAEQRLLKMRSRLVREVGELIEGMQEELHIPGDLRPATHPADLASEALDREVGVITNEQDLSAAVDLALNRIQAGTYGACANCGKRIDAERLEAIPYAIRCRACAEAVTRLGTE
jgi:RNA polymerase-binding transcription factor DksA